MSSPRLSLCMIIKNEEEYLPRCLGSVAEIVDEMIIVDTGSTDRSKEIALSFGAKVFDYKWQGDFAAARNFSLEQATGDWIMIMDGDDELAIEARGKIRDLLFVDENIQGYRFPIISFLGDNPGGPCSIVYHCRIYRNKPEHKYAGALHEQLPAGIYNNCPETAYKIYHYGYLAKVVEKQDKTNRNLVLAEQEHAAEPQNLFKMYNLGAELLRAGEFDRGEKLLIEVTEEIVGLEAYAPSAFQKLTLCYVEQNRISKALKAAREGWKKTGWDLSLLYLQGVILLSQGKTIDAVRIFEECLALKDTVKAIAFQGAGDSLALGCLSSCFNQLGRPWAAVECVAEAYRINPIYSFALKAVIAYLWQTANPEEARYYLAERCKMAEPVIDKLLAEWPENSEAKCQIKYFREKPLISLCMIIRNEVENLKKCLGTISSIVDEIIVADTGSTDETVKVAERFGADVVLIPWKDNFSLAKNETLKHAHGKWILFLDADMEISLADCGKIRKLAETGKADAYTFRVLNYLGAGSPAMRDRKIMLFRNRKSFKYSGAVYENLILKKAAGKAAIVENTDVQVSHTGFNRELAGFKAKRERNIRILRGELVKGDTPFILYCLASEYMQTGDYPAALATLEKAEELGTGKEPYFPDIIRKKALSLFHLKDFSKAKEVIQVGLDNYGNKLKDLYSILGNIYLSEQDFEQAEKALEKAIQYEDGKDPINFVHELNKEQGCVDLAKVYLEAGKWGEAIVLCLQVLQRVPDFVAATLLLSNILKTHSRQKNVEVFLDRYFNLASNDVLVSLARAFMAVSWPGLTIKLLNRIDSASADRDPGVYELKLKAYSALLGKTLMWAKEKHLHDEGVKQAWSMWEKWQGVGSEE
jgi:glycosyltransferase involved in cell wall biosynthesis